LISQTTREWPDAAARLNNALYKIRANPRPRSAGDTTTRSI
jgi:hypothetical protein